MAKLGTFAILEAHPTPIWVGPNFFVDAAVDGEDVFNDIIILKIKSLKEVKVRAFY